MLHRILVPLDGSPLAERAIPHAQRLARASGASVVLTRAVNVHVFPGTDATAAEVTAIAEAETYLDGVAGRLREAGLAVETAVPFDHAAAGIVDEIEIRGADTVVMATHGRSGLNHLLYGSVAEQVLHRSPVPVLLVRSWDEAERFERLGPPVRIVVPLDGSEFAETALDPAVRLAVDFGGDLTLVQAIVPVTEPFSTSGIRGIFDTAQWQVEAEEYLAKLALRVAEAHGIPRPAVCARLGNPPDVISGVVHESGADLVVMATHGRTGVGRVLVGSVAGQVLRECRVPLLLVNPSARVRSQHAREEMLVGTR